MDHTGSDKFALEAFSLTFAIQRIFQSRLISSEAKERLFQDYRKLKEQVGLLTKIRESREASEKMSQRNGGSTHDSRRH
jgi:hypothetical protein